MRARTEATTARRASHGRARIAAPAAAFALSFSTPASAQVPVELSGDPLHVFTDGIGRLQFRYAGQASGLFYPPSDNAARAGLELVIDRYYGLQLANGRVPGRVPTIVPGPAGTQTLSSSYFVGGLVGVEESLTYTDGARHVDASYRLTNVADVPLAVRAAEIADLYVNGDDNGTGVVVPIPPRFVGGREQSSGVVSGISELAASPWSSYLGGYYEAVFDAFQAGAFANAVDFGLTDNGVGAQWSLTLTPGQPQTLLTRWLLAVDPPPGSIFVNQPPPPQPTPAPPPAPTAAPPPAPVAGRTVNLKRANGKVRYRLPGTTRYAELTGDVQVPVGTTLDTRTGRVTITSASDLTGGTNHAWFYEGIFKVGQARAAKPVTELALAGPKPSCRATASARRRPRSRKLWGDGSGRFRTRGQFSSATVRGTKWVVVDRCDGTLTRVVRGSVLVRDAARHTSVVVRAGKQYLARRPKRK